MYKQKHFGFSKSLNFEVRETHNSTTSFSTEIGQVQALFPIKNKELPHHHRPVSSGTNLCSTPKPHTEKTQIKIKNPKQTQTQIQSTDQSTLASKNSELT